MRSSCRDRRDAALGVCIALAVLALIFYELRGGYEDLQLLRRGTASFAYVTRVSASWASKNGARSDRCELEAMIPREIQAQTPQVLPDMTGARYFTSYEPDSDRACRGYLHTWQPILFDPADRGHARFAWGLKQTWLELVAVAVGLIGLAVGVRVVRAARRFRVGRSAS